MGSTPPQRCTQRPLLLVALTVGASVWSVLPAASYRLSPCQLVNQTVYLEKEGCPQCYIGETTICSGHCHTEDSVVKTLMNPLKALHSPEHLFQKVCTYASLSSRTELVPGCPAHEDPFITFPVALSCHCSVCATDTSDCSVYGLQPQQCTNQLPYYY